MLTLKEFRFATVDELFEYKSRNIELLPFGGYSKDQWGIKAHNRPWIIDAGSFKKGQKIIEVGGAFSTLPVYIAHKYGLEAWIGDDFGAAADEVKMWSRWGDPYELPKKYPDMNYIFKPFGKFSKEYQDNFFDRVFSVSTLEHIPFNCVLPVLKDMHRVLKKGGIELHSIDVVPIGDISIINGLKYILNSDTKKLNRNVYGYKNIILAMMLERLSLKTGVDLFIGKLKYLSPIWQWLKLFEKSGVDISIITSKNYPYMDTLLSKNTLFESYDGIYRFRIPINKPKKYNPTASLLMIIEDL